MAVLTTHLELDHGEEDIAVWSLGAESKVRVIVGNYDKDGYTVSLARFVLSGGEAAGLYHALGRHLGLLQKEDQ